MLPNEIREQIEFEIEEIESLFELYKEELFGIKQKPDLLMTRIRHAEISG